MLVHESGATSRHNLFQRVDGANNDEYGKKYGDRNDEVFGASSHTFCFLYIAIEYLYLDNRRLK